MNKRGENSKKIEYILDKMHEMFRDFPMTELQFETPFQCLIAVMMSAQTTDVQVNKVTATLFKKIKSPADVLRMGQEEFGKSIKSIGLRTGKAKNIYATSQRLIELAKEYELQKKLSAKSVKNNKKSHPGSSYHEYYTSPYDIFTEFGYVIPDSIESLRLLPGVGIKTAKVVLYVLYGQRHVAVDTHVHRVMNRLGVVNTNTPEQTSKQLETIISDTYKDIAHKTIIYFGRYQCTARNPKCLTCPLQHICPYFKNIESVKILLKSASNEK